MTYQLKDSRCREASFIYTVWAANPEVGISIDELLKPEAWAHVARKLKAWDEIVVRPDDGAYYARLLVVDTDQKTWVKVQKIEYVAITVQTASKSMSVDGYTIRFRGPRCWCVQRDSDNTFLVEDLRTKIEAVAWLSEHSKRAA